MHCSLSSLSRDERRLRSIKIENSALFFVKGRALFFVRDDRRLRSIKRENSALFFVKEQEDTEVNKKRKQCTVLCQGMRGEKIVHCSLSRDERRLRSIKRENSALFFVFFVFFVKRRKEIEVNKNRKQCTILCQGMCTILC